MADYTQDLPPELAAEQMRIARRRQIAEAMMAQSQRQQPIQHWTQGAAQLANAYLGKKKMDEVEAAQAKLGQQYTQGRDAEMAKITSAMTPQTAIGPDEQGVGPTRPEMPASQEKVRQALIAAQQSAYPQVRSFGAGQQKFIEQDQARQDTQAARVFQAEQAANQHLTGIREAEKERRITKEDADAREATLRKELEAIKAKNSGNKGDGGEYGTYLPVTDPATGRVSYQFGVQKGPRAGQIVMPPSGGGAPAQYSPEAQKQIAVAKETGKLAGKDFANIGDYNDASASLKAASDITKKGIYTGTLAEWKLAGSKAAGLVGGDTTKASNTEQFKQHIAETVIPMLKLLGGNDTDEERKYLERMMSGDIRLEPATINAKLESAQKKLDNKARRARENAGQAAPTSAPASGGWSIKRLP